VRPPVAVTVAVLLPLFLSCGARRLPDVIVITLDTTRADRLGCYGYFRDTTPNLDALARRSILFENAITHMATTLPAHVSLFTSTHTVTHGIQGNLAAFDVAWSGEGGPRIAGRIFAELGYETAGFVSTAPLKAITGMSDGFGFWREPEGNECRADETTDAVLHWLRTAPPGPLFLWVHYFDPHDRYDPPAPFDERWQTDDALVAYLRDHHYTYWEHPQIRKINNLYDGEVAFMDAQVGRLLAGLDAAGRLDGAALVVVGDHGEGMGQHDWVSHSRIHDETLRVPLLLKLPGMRDGDGRRSDRLTALVDVLPTLVDELDLPVPAEETAAFEGTDAVADPPWDYVFSERTHGRSDIVGPGLRYALTGRKWKYLLSTQRPDELYDLETDPGELVDVIDEHPDVAAGLRDRVLARLAASPARERDMPELPPEYVEELRALGYVK